MGIVSQTWDECTDFLEKTPGLYSKGHARRGATETCIPAIPLYTPLLQPSRGSLKRLSTNPARLPAIPPHPPHVKGCTVPLRTDYTSPSNLVHAGFSLTAQKVVVVWPASGPEPCTTASVRFPVWLWRIRIFPCYGFEVTPRMVLVPQSWSCKGRGGSHSMSPTGCDGDDAALSPNYVVSVRRLIFDVTVCGPPSLA